MVGNHHCKLEFFFNWKTTFKDRVWVHKGAGCIFGLMNKIVIPLFVLNRFSSTEERTLDLVRFDNFVMGSDCFQTVN